MLIDDKVSGSGDEQSAGDGCSRKVESRCVAVQTDRNQLRYITKSPFLQKMEAELISSVVENLNQDHECRCNCPPPPLFWYQITRPQVLRNCRGSQTTAPVRKKVVTEEEEVEPDRSATIEDETTESESIDKKSAHSVDDKASKLHAANDAGLARIIDRELKSKKWQRLPTPPRPPLSRPKTPLPVERPLKVDASTQVETLVIQPKLKTIDVGGRPQKQETTLEGREVEHKYVQTMDEEDIFKPEEKANLDHSDLPSDPISVDFDEPAMVPYPDAISSLPDDESAELIDWSPFCVAPLQRRSSTDWLNIHLKDVSVKDYDTDWGELTRALPVKPEDPFIDWMAIDIRPQPKPHKCGEAPPTPTPSPPPSPPLSSPPIPPPLEQEDILDELALQPLADLPNEDVPQAPSSRQESPARMMTPDAEDVLTGCEDPSLLLGPDDISTMVVLQWTPIVIKSDTSAAQVRLRRGE